MRSTVWGNTRPSIRYPHRSSSSCRHHNNKWFYRFSAFFRVGNGTTHHSGDKSSAHTVVFWMSWKIILLNRQGRSMAWQYSTRRNACYFRLLQDILRFRSWSDTYGCTGPDGIIGVRRIGNCDIHASHWVSHMHQIFVHCSNFFKIASIRILHYLTTTSRHRSVVLIALTIC